MLRCPACSHEAQQGARFCPRCGSAVGPSEGEATGAYQPADPKSAFGLLRASSSNDDQLRFTPSQVLAGRYRIVTLLGKGGMGEVYRADDLTLGQPVALKFLPKQIAGDPARLAQFRKEVRLARQVSHPNVCRVYDVGEFDGLLFLTMEYIDGEDLAVLLRRIGRLPEDKGIDLARQLSLALAAAHDKGLLHRDLKPANVMIDGRGQVRLTDFGLAGDATEFQGTDVRAGTPIYQAPEQRAGREVTAQSDLYALGLVLYELFTGKRAFPAENLEELARLQSEATPSKPSSHVAGLDPEVEGLILRCLEKEPRDRPKSALAVAAALPGGDMLAAALAGGRTPSPEMVAKANVEGSLPPWVAAGLLGTILLGIFLCSALKETTDLNRIVRLAQSPEALTADARRILDGLGLDVPPRDSASSFYSDREFIAYQQRKAASPTWWDKLREERPSAMYFWYVQSDSPLDVTVMEDGWKFGKPSPGNPPLTRPGMASLFLDPKGKLLALQVVPREHQDIAAPKPVPPWSLLFKDAGFDLADFTEAPPQWTPPVPCDFRAAWISKASEPSWRIEAAALLGQPTYFEVLGPWSVARKQSSHDHQQNFSGASLFPFVLSLAVLFFGGPLAYRSWQLGRADLAGAGRVALVVLLFALLSKGVVETHYVADLSILLRILFGAIGMSLFDALTVWVAYLAMEPFVRRRWALRLVDWNRLLQGRWKDPLIGRGILFGGLAGVTCAGISLAAQRAPTWLGFRPDAPYIPYEGSFNPLLRFSQVPAIAVVTSLTWYFFMFLACRLFRKEWIAALAVLALSLAIGFFGSNDQTVWIGLAVGGMLTGILLTIGLRCGLWSLTVAFGFNQMLFWSVIGLDWSTWYAPATAVNTLIPVALAVFGFWASKAGQPLLGKEVFE